MTDDPYLVRANETGITRIFTAKLDPVGVTAFTVANVEKLLGADVTLNPAKVEVFSAEVIGPIGLATYLADGYGIKESDLKDKRAALDALTDLIVIIPSSAFQGTAQTLDPNPALTFIGVFHEPDAVPPFQMARVAATEGRVTLPKAGLDQARLKQQKGSWVIALGALIFAAALVLFAVF
ncbi:hypothetical protein N9L47_01730 [Rhodobacteraceae bacterium]|nr:hypothetical protein [Paracoccaceae bacterium]